ncbi:MAG TPA: protein-ADP-ribose hydrolase [Candidatus Copromorpha excrementigallinarum]|uniref:Protein-ADP-ribose hydrolase n=1 Tax=Candidatus Allocopromorpha excrementigallinarum TaxID=2840742 RepID=A0A9D1HZ04_9FIRM|nr:protein-ADP-ribose hydrolase [Candidatus Copromorpha excrementigallinarum]
MTQEERRTYLIDRLLKEQPRYCKIEIPGGEEERKALLRSLFNIRPPWPADAEFLKVQDDYLREETRLKGITDIKELEPVDEDIYIWQGDITTLRCDAIVNAANSQMLGCFIPCHGCIDNAIHTYAGIELRLECADIMERQGHEEETGGAKITPAFNLPCKYVIHTVGPIVTGALTEKDRRLLYSCYSSCLELAAEKGIESIAFCCISTGEFHFPNEEAAKIAVKAVREFRERFNGRMKVVFNVFKEKDLRIYRELFLKYT